MKFKRSSQLGSAETDMTPMIDMTFQLIAFFMVLMNFSEAEQNELINLPSSALAKPPDAPLKLFFTLQLDDDGTIFFGGLPVPKDQLPGRLSLEAEIMQAKGDSPSDATMLIRGDGDAKTGEVQELIEVCQKAGFETFRLRAKQEEGGDK